MTEWHWQDWQQKKPSWRKGYEWLTAVCVWRPRDRNLSSAGNPLARTKHHVDRQTRCEVMAISKAALFDREHTNLYSSSIVNMPYLLLFQRYSRIGWKSLPFSLVFGALAVKPSDLRNDPWWRKTRRMILSESERILMICSLFSRFDTIHACDRQTDMWTELP